MSWSRKELEDAFATYKQAAATAAKTGDWNPRADCFTEDAEYFEHLYGVMKGREAIRSWINDTMGKPPGSQMPEFPVEWHIVDEERGWIVCQIWNRMDDPGDGSIHQAYNITILKYGGDGLWAYEEDVYNPYHFQKMIGEWNALKEKLSS
jgi:hypothetical protein